MTEHIYIHTHTHLSRLVSRDLKDLLRCLEWVQQVQHRCSSTSKHLCPPGPHSSLMPTEQTWKNVHNSVTQGNARNPPKCPPGTGIMLRTTKAAPQTTRSNMAPQRNVAEVRTVSASGRWVWEGLGSLSQPRAE